MYDLWQMEAATEIRDKQRLLERLAQKLGLEVLYEPMGANRLSSPGGLCKIRSRHTIFVDANAPPVEQIGVLLEALGQFNVDSLFVPPAIRREIARRRK